MISMLFRTPIYRSMYFGSPDFDTLARVPKMPLPPCTKALHAPNENIGHDAMAAEDGNFSVAWELPPL